MTPRVHPRGFGKIRYGPLGKPYKNDLEGKTFGKMIVVEFDGFDANGFTMWYCRCNLCGTYKSVLGSSLAIGKTTSCGCAHITHGFTRGGHIPEYKIWTKAKGRCFNPNNPAYDDYGGRGITMCKAWKDNFVPFHRDMGLRPSPDHSIDRINNDGHYSCGKCEECLRNGWPANCEWATHKQQARNRRSTVFIEHDGQRKSLAEWAEMYNLDIKTLWRRLYNCKMPIAIALSKKLPAVKKVVDSPLVSP